MIVLSIIVQLSSKFLFIIVFMFVTCTPVRGFGQNKNSQTKDFLEIKYVNSY